MLRENLAALAKHDVELAQRLCWPAGDDHVGPGPDGTLSYKIGRSSFPLELSPERARQSLAEAGPHGEGVFLFGLGLGEIATAILRVFDVMACGAFVLAERSEDLGALFDLGVEVDSWATPRELSAKVAHYLAHPHAAQELARRGREAVLGRLTIQARVEHMLRVAGWCRSGF